jgi:hypothetical protein
MKPIFKQLLDFSTRSNAAALECLSSRSRGKHGKLSLHELMQFREPLEIIDEP